MPRERFLVFGSPLIEQPEIDEVVDCLRSGWIGTGPRVTRFEEQFREYIGADHGVAMNSCTAALHLSLLALGVGPGDEVIVPSMTFVATSNAVVHAGVTPVLVDCDRRSMNVDPETIETEWKGRHAGTFGEIGCFSFYVTKNVVTGEGRMAITSRRDLADQMRTLALHGMTKNAWRRFSDKGYVHYDVVAAGFKYNMMDIQAALGLHQLKRLDGFIAERGRLAARYDEAFRGVSGLILPARVPYPARHAWHLYTPLVDIDRLTISRDRFMAELKAKNIGTGLHYTAAHEFSYYAGRFGWKPEDYPEAHFVSERIVSLPLFPGLSDADQDDAIAAVREVLAERAR